MPDKVAAWTLALATVVIAGIGFVWYPMVVAGIFGAVGVLVVLAMLKDLFLHMIRETKKVPRDRP